MHEDCYGAYINYRNDTDAYISGPYSIQIVNPPKMVLSSQAAAFIQKRDLIPPCSHFKSDKPLHPS